MFQTTRERRIHYLDKHVPDFEVEAELLNQPSEKESKDTDLNLNTQSQSKESLQNSNAQNSSILEDGNDTLIYQKAEQILQERLAERQVKHFICEEPGCEERFGSIAEMNYHFVMTHQQIEMIDFVNDADSNKENQDYTIPRKRFKHAIGEVDVTPRKYKLGKLSCFKCKLRFETLDDQREHQKLIHGSISIISDPTILISSEVPNTSKIDVEKTVILYICNQCQPPRLMNFKAVREHQEHEEPEHIAENLTVFQSVLKDEKVLCKSSILLPDAAYIKDMDGICPQTVIRDHWMENTNEGRR